MTPLVLVHGGGFDSRCWDLLLPHLTSPAIAVDLPGRGRRPGVLDVVTFDRCARAIVEDIEAAGFDDVVLVAHSLGGCVMAPALYALGGRVRHIIFLAAMVPQHGNCTAQEWSTDLKKRIGDEHDTAPRQTMTAENVKIMFGNDMDDAQVAWCIERLVPEAPSLSHEPVDLAPLRSAVTRSWILTTKDAILTPDMQRRFICNVAGGCEVHEIDAGHMCMISQPAACALLIEDLAASGLKQVMNLGTPTTPTLTNRRRIVDHI